jgi:hypothetical protein
MGLVRRVVSGGHTMIEKRMSRAVGSFLVPRR